MNYSDIKFRRNREPLFPGCSFKVQSSKSRSLIKYEIVLRKLVPSSPVCSYFVYEYMLYNLVTVLLIYGHSAAYRVPSGLQKINKYIYTQNSNTYTYIHTQNAKHYNIDWARRKFQIIHTQGTVKILLGIYLHDLFRQH